MLRSELSYDWCLRLRNLRRDRCVINSRRIVLQLGAGLRCAQSIQGGVAIVAALVNDLALDVGFTCRVFTCDLALEFLEVDGILLEGDVVTIDDVRGKR